MYKLSRWQLEEMKAVCLQYPDKIRRARELLVRPGIRYDLTRSGSAAESDPVVQIVIRRERLERDIRLIDQAAADTAGGAWTYGLIEHCCKGVSYDHLDQAKLPTANRNAFFQAAAEFYVHVYLAMYAEE